ncbi:MAG: DUF4446 family protein [Firmicutes bacterium]|nr:DUF4446 family protein [Bacillota bacterium]MCL5040536.1 DUF4446 family protein [Bacillota bacterium]
MGLDLAVNELTAFLLGLIFLTIALLAAVILLAIKLNRTLKRLHALLEVRPGANLEDLLLHLAEKSGSLEEKINTVTADQKELKERSKAFLQQVGVVRFNAFEGVGSDLSFAVAIMDGEKNGVVLSSLYGRDESRIYGKPLSQGRSTYLLTDEEKEAISLACHRKT